MNRSHVYTYNRAGTIIRNSLPKEKRLRLTEEQIGKLKTVSSIALVIIGVAGIIALSAVAPNIFYALDKIFGNKAKKPQLSRRDKVAKVTRTFYYLKEQGLIKTRSQGNNLLVFLTSLGKRRLKKVDFESLAIKRPKSWNGKWWQVAADIPTKKYKRGADLLRMKLKDLGFFSLQRTLWFYPFDPREEIEFIVRHYGIARFVTVMEINHLDRDDEKKMKSFFRLHKIL